MLDKNLNLYFTQISKQINLSFCDGQYLIDEGPILKKPAWQFCDSSTTAIPTSSSSSSNAPVPSSSSSSSSSSSCYTGPRVCDQTGERPDRHIYGMPLNGQQCFCEPERGCDCYSYDTFACCCCACCYEPDTDPCSPTYGCCIYTGCSTPGEACYSECNPP